MNKAGKILSVNPGLAIPGGEISIVCEGLKIENTDSFGCFFNNQKARIIGASAERVLAIVPDELDGTDVDVYFENENEKSEPFRIVVGKLLADDLHQVANPAIDPHDGSIIVTRSGSRGQSLPVTMFRLEADGFLTEMKADVLNPTGLAFNNQGKLFATNRADGEVYQFNDDEAVPIESDLGVATGIAFDKSGNMFVGDRSGTIYKISGMGDRESWAMLEPSVSAFHLAFGSDGLLYVSAPGLCSHDSVYRFDQSGQDSVFFKGLGRPQGLAFDKNGDLYVAACYQGRHGIVKISEEGESIELFVAGMGVVGLCFDRNGDLIAATNNAVYSLPIGVYGILLNG